MLMVRVVSGAVDLLQTEVLGHRPLYVSQYPVGREAGIGRVVVVGETRDRDAQGEQVLDEDAPQRLPLLIPALVEGDVVP